MRLSELNRQISSDKLIWIFAVVIFLAALILFVLYIAFFKRINAPPQTPDGYQYDAIALQLSKGRGFSFNWDDPDLNEPYKDHNSSGSDDHIEERHGEGATTYRPPLLPFLMAANYRMFGRIFWPMRVINSILLAITCVLIFIILSRRFGILPGMLGVVLFHFDPRTQYFVSLILTESPAILMVKLICWLLLITVESRSLWAALLLGAITGFAFLLRSVFILWVPLIVIGVYLLGKSRMRS